MPPQVARMISAMTTNSKSPSKSSVAPVDVPSSISASKKSEQGRGAHGGKLKHKRRYCRIEGCERIVKSQGLCQRHGAKPRLCKVQGCQKQAQGNFDGMCKSHFKEHKRKTTPITHTDDTLASTPPTPEGSSVFDGVLPASVDFFPTHAPIMAQMPLVKHLREGFEGGKAPAWHRNEERKARGLLPIQNPATQLEGWERELVWMEILVLTGVPEVSFRHLARAWGRDKGFHMVLAQFICERHGDVERKKRKRDAEEAEAEAVAKRAKEAKKRVNVPVDMKQLRVAMLSPERKKQLQSLLRRRSSDDKKDETDDIDELIGADVWDETCYGDANYNEALAADLFNLTPEESAVLMKRLSSKNQGMNRKDSGQKQPRDADDDSNSTYTKPMPQRPAIIHPGDPQQHSRYQKKQNQGVAQAPPSEVAVKEGPPSDNEESLGPQMLGDDGQRGLQHEQQSMSQALSRNQLMAHDQGSQQDLQHHFDLSRQQLNQNHALEQQQKYATAPQHTQQGQELRQPHYAAAPQHTQQGQELQQPHYAAASQHTQQGHELQQPHYAAAPQHTQLGHELQQPHLQDQNSRVLQNPPDYQFQQTHVQVQQSNEYHQTYPSQEFQQSDVQHQNSNDLHEQFDHQFQQTQQPASPGHETQELQVQQPGSNDLEQHMQRTVNLQAHTDQFQHTQHSGGELHPGQEHVQHGHGFQEPQVQQPNLNDAQPQEDQFQQHLQQATQLYKQSSSDMQQQNHPYEQQHYQLTLQPNQQMHDSSGVQGQQVQVQEQETSGQEGQVFVQQVQPQLRCQHPDMNSNVVQDEQQEQQQHFDQQVRPQDQTQGLHQSHPSQHALDMAQQQYTQHVQAPLPPSLQQEHEHPGQQIQDMHHFAHAQAQDQYNQNMQLDFSSNHPQVLHERQHSQGGVHLHLLGQPAHAAPGFEQQQQVSLSDHPQSLHHRQHSQQGHFLLQPGQYSMSQQSQPLYPNAYLHQRQEQQAQSFQLSHFNHAPPSPQNGPHRSQEAYAQNPLDNQLQPDYNGQPLYQHHNKDHDFQNHVPNQDFNGEPSLHHYDHENEHMQAVEDDHEDKDTDSSHRNHDYGQQQEIQHNEEIDHQHESNSVNQSQSFAPDHANVQQSQAFQHEHPNPQQGQLFAQEPPDFQQGQAFQHSDSNLQQTEPFQQSGATFPESAPVPASYYQQEQNAVNASNPSFTPPMNTATGHQYTDQGAVATFHDAHNQNGAAVSYAPQENEGPSSQFSGTEGHSQTMPHFQGVTTVGEHHEEPLFNLAFTNGGATLNEQQQDVKNQHHQWATGEAHGSVQAMGQQNWSHAGEHATAQDMAQQQQWTNAEIQAANLGQQQQWATTTNAYAPAPSGSHEPWPTNETYDRGSEALAQGTVSNSPGVAEMPNDRSTEQFQYAEENNYVIVEKEQLPDPSVQQNAYASVESQNAN